MSIRVLVVILDGFRRDFLGEATTPTLWSLSRAGSDFPHSRAVFPSATRVNASAISTGTLPAVNGIVANRFFDPNVFTDRLIDTSRLDHLRALDRAYDGALFTAGSLGEVLAEAGRSMAVVTSGSEGTTFLANPRAARNGHVALAVKDWASSVPRDFADAALAHLGPIPPLARPNAARSRYVTDLFVDFVEPRLKPDVALLWYNDPDKTLHTYGPGTPQCLAALSVLDEQVARLLDWRRKAGLEESVQIIVASDHGHVTGTDAVDLNAEFAHAGFPVAGRSDRGAALVGALGYYGTVTDMTPGKMVLPKLVDWLMTRPWCGCLFTRGGNGTEGGVPGTFAMTLLGGEHPRMPDLYFVMDGDDRPNEHGVPGCVYFDGGQPAGAGLHGGLNPRELTTLLVAHGSRFRAGFSSPLHAGDIDIAPTVLALLGLETPATMRGRVLREAMSGPQHPESVKEARVQRGRRVQRLRYADNGAARYFDGAWVERG